MTCTNLPPRTGQQFSISHGDYHAVVTELGATLRKLTYQGEDIIVSPGPDDMVTCCHGQLLIPFPNRIENGEYTFEGKTYTLPIDEHERRNAIHGYGKRAFWKLVSLKEDAVTLSWRAPNMEGYPFDIVVTATYSLADDGLHLNISAYNNGDADAPWALAIHPWLANGFNGYGDEIDAHNAKCSLTVPGRTHVTVNENLIPTGTEPVDGTKYDLRKPTLLTNQPFDDAWTDVEHDADGKTTYTYKDVMDGTDSANVNADTKYEKPGYSYKTVKADGTAGDATETGCTSTDITTCEVTITNKHTPETVSLSVTKHWDDAGNQLGQRPKTLTFWVLSSIWKNGGSTQKEYLPGWPTPQTATGECSKSVADYTTGLAGATGLTVSGTAWGKSCIVLAESGAVDASDAGLDSTDTAETWPTYTFENLPKYYKGQEIHYDVTESMPTRLANRSDDYEATVKETTQSDGTLAFDVTNRYRYVVLPETGGSGINSKPAAILIAISSICLIGACAMKTHENRKRHALGRSMR